MRAIAIEDKRLVLHEVPEPEAREGEVVIDIEAAGVNRADVMQRHGNYPQPVDYPGLECAGVIGAVGPGVTGHRVGDRVAALLMNGGYAERVAVPAGQVMPVPAGITVRDAAALPEVACTVWSTVVDHNRLRAGETLLVHGGGSGIGTFAIQLGKALGATVVTTARAPKHDALRDLGADLVIDYTSADFVAATREFTGGKGADVVLDLVGGPYLERNVEVLAADGRITALATPGGARAELHIGRLMAKRGTIYSAGLRARPAEQKARIVAATVREVWPLIEAGSVRPVVAATFPLSEAAEAQALMETSDHVGKILLLP